MRRSAALRGDIVDRGTLSFRQAGEPPKACAKALAALVKASERDSCLALFGTNPVNGGAAGGLSINQYGSHSLCTMPKVSGEDQATCHHVFSSIPSIHHPTLPLYPSFWLSPYPPVSFSSF